MNKKILVTSTDLMMIQFLVPHIKNLSEQGYDVEIVCSNVGGRVDEVRKKLQKYVNKMYIVQLYRSPVNFNNIHGYRQLTKIINGTYYDIIWTNEPVMGVVTRLAAREARKAGTKLLYMVHGFHFYKGAPLLNWMLFYPIEKVMASKCDVICTVNHEDYQRVQKFHVKETKYIHGIGINTDRLTLKEERNDIRRELGLERNAFIVLSIGELNKNKNQAVIIKAISLIKDSTIHYLLCGKGNQLEKLKNQVEELHLEKQVHFLGYRTDVVDICSQANIYVMPSKREGLPVSSLEAMYCGLPLVTSNIRGLNDIMEDEVSGYMCNPDDYKMFAKRIKKLKANPELCKKMGMRNKEAVELYCIDNSKKEVIEVLKGI